MSSITSMALRKKADIIRNGGAIEPEVLEYVAAIIEKLENIKRYNVVVWNGYSLHDDEDGCEYQFQKSDRGMWVDYNDISNILKGE